MTHPQFLPIAEIARQLKSLGHETAKAIEIALDVHRGDQTAITWCEIARVRIIPDHAPTIKFSQVPIGWYFEYAAGIYMKNSSISAESVDEDYVCTFGPDSPCTIL